VKHEVKAKTEGDSVFDLKLLDKEVVDETEESVIVDVEILFYRTFKGDKVVASDNPPQKFVDELKGGFYKEEYKGTIVSDVKDADLYDNKCVRKKLKVELVKPKATEGIELQNELGEFDGKLGSNSVSLSFEATLSNDNGTLAWIGKNSIATLGTDGEFDNITKFFDTQTYNEISVNYFINNNGGQKDFRGDGSDIAQPDYADSASSGGFDVVKQSDGTELLKGNEVDGQVNGTRYSKSGKYLAVHGGNTNFHNNPDTSLVFDAENNYNKVFETTEKNFGTSSFSKNDKYLAVGGGSTNGALIFDVSTFTLHKRLLSGTGIQCVRFDQALETLYVRTQPGNTFTFDVQNGFAKTSRSFGTEDAEWFGGRYLVVGLSTSIEIRDKKNNYNVISSEGITEDTLTQIDINNSGTKVVVSQETSGLKGAVSGSPEVFATGFDPGPNLGSVFQSDSSGVKQTNSSGVVLTQA